MSAINKHLSFVDLTDFTPGLFTEGLSTNQFSMPQAAAQQMDNCMPLKQGGIRAFFKPSQLSSSGITVASEVPTGAGLISSLPLRSGVGDAAYRFITTLSGADNKTRLYRMDQSAGSSTWSQKDASYTLAAAGNNSGLMTSFHPFLDNSGALWMIMVVRDNSTGQGVYKIAYVAGAGPPAGDGVLTKLNNKFGASAVNQARIMVADGGSTNPWRLYYGDPGLTTGAITTLASFLDVAPNQIAADIAGIVGTEPSDIMILKQGAPWVEISGDISSATTAVREMGTGHFGVFGVQEPVRTPTGMAFIEPGGYIYLTDGRQFTNISLPIDRFYQIDGGSGAQLNPGKMAFLGSFLFAPKGYIRDWETGAWFRSSHFSNAAFLIADPRKLKIWGINGGLNFDQWDLAPFDRTTGLTPTPRYDTWTWRSAPLTPPDGRETRIREVQLFVRCSGTTDFTVTRTDADGTQVVRFLSGVTAAAGEQMLSFLFPNSGSPYQDITVTPAAQSSSVEAAIVERIRIGFALGHQR